MCAQRLVLAPCLAATAVLALLAGCRAQPAEPLSAEPLQLGPPEASVSAILRRPGGAATRASALVLLSEAARDGEAWDPFAAEAARRGYVSLAVALPEPDNADAADAVLIAALRRLRGVTGGPVALLGAGIGANRALQFAASHPGVAAVGMLSPGLDYRGVTTRDAIARLEDCPVLLVAAGGDAYAAMSARELKAEAEGFVELHEYRGSARGTGILDASPEAREQIFIWLAQVVGPGAAPPERGADSGG